MEADAEKGTFIDDVDWTADEMMARIHAWLGRRYQELVCPFLGNRTIEFSPRGFDESNSVFIGEMAKVLYRYSQIYGVDHEICFNALACFLYNGEPVKEWHPFSIHGMLWLELFSSGVQYGTKRCNL